MRLFFRIVFSLFILLPCLLLGYQNCSNIENNSSSNNATSFIGNPVFLNDLSFLGYQEPQGCADVLVSEPSSYKSTAHICAQAKNNCESTFLKDNGFSLTDSQNCDEVTDPTESDFLSSLKVMKVSELGFTAQTDQVCSFQFATMIHFGLRTCASASNGCEIGFLADQGFLNDQASLCPF